MNPSGNSEADHYPTAESDESASTHETELRDLIREVESLRTRLANVEEERDQARLEIANLQEIVGTNDSIDRIRHRHATVLEQLEHDEAALSAIGEEQQRLLKVQAELTKQLAQRTERLREEGKTYIREVAKQIIAMLIGFVPILFVGSYGLLVSITGTLFSWDNLVRASVICSILSLPLALIGIYIGLHAERDAGFVSRFFPRK